MRRGAEARTWTIHEPGNAKAAGSFSYNGVWISLTFAPEASSQGARSETFELREVDRSWTAVFE